MENELVKELSNKAIDYKKIREESIFVLYDTEEYYDFNFIIPVRGRTNFAAPMYDSFCKAREKSGLKIAYTVVEFSDIPEHSKFCKKNKINYIWIKSEQGELFNKCLAMNFGALFSVKAKYFLFHDLDCLIQSDFFINLNSNISKKNSCKAIQCFHSRRVLYLDQNTTDGIIGGSIALDELKLGSEGVSLPMYLGAPGGSICIEKDLFFSVGGYDPEFFQANAPEDIFFWDKVCTLDSMQISDEPQIDLFHMNHPPTYYSNPLIGEMTNIYNTFKNSDTDSKKNFISEKEKTIKEFYYA